MSTISPPNTDVVWAQVEDGFYVGSRHGEFLGYVDVETETRHIVCNMYSQQVGEFTSLAEAMHALEAMNRSEEGAPDVA